MTTFISSAGETVSVELNPDGSFTATGANGGTTNYGANRQDCSTDRRRSRLPSENASCAEKIGLMFCFWARCYAPLGSDRGGDRAAAMYSLIQTCRLNDVDPHAWLADVIARISDHPQSRLNELLPWNWKVQRPIAKAA